VNGILLCYVLTAFRPCRVKGDKTLQWCPPTTSYHLLSTMTTHTHHCILGESNVSLSIDAASDVSLISASIVYKLNLPCIFDKSGLQRSPIHVKFLTLGGCYISRMDLAIFYGLSSDILLGSDWILPCQPVFIDEYPFISNPTPETIRTISPPHTWQQISGWSSCPRVSYSLTSPLVTDNLVHLISTSHPQARDVLASMLERCCADVALCNDLFVDHRVETCCETDEERRDALLHHLLDGLCVLRPDIPYCKSFGRGLVSTMNLWYKICMLLLSAHQCKRVTLSTFRLCCAAIGQRRNVDSPKTMCRTMTSRSRSLSEIFVSEWVL